MLTGLPPFYSQNINEIYAGILNKPISFPQAINISPQGKDLIRKLLEKSPQRRLGTERGVKEILEHPWCK